MNPEFMDSVVGVYSIPIPQYRDPIYGPQEKAVCLAILRSHLDTGFHAGSDPYESLHAIVHCTISDMQILSSRTFDDLECLVWETNRENPEWCEKLNDPK